MLILAFEVIVVQQPKHTFEIALFFSILEHFVPRGEFGILSAKKYSLFSSFYQGSNLICASTFNTFF